MQFSIKYTYNIEIFILFGQLTKLLVREIDFWRRENGISRMESIKKTSGSTKEYKMALKKTISRKWSCEKERREGTAKEDKVERITQKDVIVWSTRRHKGETIS